MANHASHADTILLLSALPAKERRRTVVAAAMDSFFMDYRQAIKTVFVFNAIPVDRLKVNRRSAQLAIDLVEDDWNLVIYPEGGRTPDGNLQEFKGGAAYLAERTKATVIPTYIHESGYIKAPSTPRPRLPRRANERRHHVIVAFGRRHALRRGREHAPLRCSHRASRRGPRSRREPRPQLRTRREDPARVTDGRATLGVEIISDRRERFEFVAQTDARISSANHGFIASTGPCA